MDDLIAYLPEDRAHALACGADLPDRTDGAALFADISGFTPLTEALTQTLGSRAGAEVLTDQINAVYAALTTAVARWHGSVISFAGDAVTCWFDAVDGPAAPRAAACARDLQAAMAPFVAVALPDGRTASLRIKVAIASGPARRFVVGSPAVQQFDVLAGATLARMACGEHLAYPGEVLLDAVAVAALGPSATLGERRADPAHDESFHVLYTLDTPPAADPWPPLVLPAESARSWVLPVVWERYRAGLGTFLTELRPAVVMFLRFGGIDFDGDNQAGLRLDALIRQAQAILADTGGSLLQITVGDKGAYLYATFGAPVAHEDDARRAARAALALHATVAALGLPPVQIGMSRGALRCGAYGGTSRRIYGVIGDDVNLAARLMSQAAPGETLLSVRVQSTLGDAFSLEPRAPITLKGKAESLPVFALTGVSRRRAIRLQEPTYALPMVGRERDLAAIQVCLAHASAGQGHVVIIVAEAGMGKSRLVAEVVRLARRHGCTGYGGAATANGTQSPYVAWRPIVQALLDVDPDAPLRRQLRHLTSELGDRVPHRAEALPLLDLLLERDLPENDFTQALQPQDRKGAREALLCDLLAQAAHEAGAASGSLLLVIEDAHWLDPLSADLLLRVAQEACALPLVLVVATRSVAVAQLVPIAALSHATTMILDKLDATAMAGLVRAKLTQIFPARVGGLPTGLVTTLETRAQGNPFYAEELLNYLRDQGIAPDDPAALAGRDLPDSLHQLVLARIDQLTEGEQATLRVASVVGRLFRAAWLPGFAPELGALPQVCTDLERLAQADLTPLDMPEPELAYLFKHIVTQEAAYASLPQTTRARLHGALADWLEAAMPDTPPLDLLAYHYDHSDNLPKRREYLRRAGEAAAAQFANAVAIDYLSRALALAPDDDVKERWALLCAREAVYDLIGQRAEQAADIAALTALSADDPLRHVDVTLRTSVYLLATGDFRAAAETAAQVLRLTAGAPTREADTRLVWGRALKAQDDLPGARAQLAWVLDWARANGDPQRELQALRPYAMASRWDGWRRVQQQLQQARALSHAIGDQRSEMVVLGDEATAALNQGDYAAARAAYTQAHALAQRIGHRAGALHAQSGLSGVAAALGDYARARALAEHSLQLCQTINDRQGEAMVRHALGEIAHQQGDLTAADDWYRQSLTLARATGDQNYEAMSLRSLGYVLTARGQIDAAISHFTEGLALSTALGDAEDCLLSRVGLAQALLKQGDLAHAYAQVEPLLTHVPSDNLEVGADGLRAYYDIYRGLHAVGHPRAARLLAQMHTCIMTQAAPLDTEDQHRFLEHVPLNRAIVAAWKQQQAA